MVARQFTIDVRLVGENLASCLVEFKPPPTIMSRGVPPWSSGSVGPQITTTRVRMPVWAYLKVVSFFHFVSLPLKVARPI